MSLRACSPAQRGQQVLRRSAALHRRDKGVLAREGAQRRLQRGVDCCGGAVRSVAQEQQALARLGGIGLRDRARERRNVLRRVQERAAQEQAREGACARERLRAQRVVFAAAQKERGLNGHGAAGEAAKRLGQAGNGFPAPGQDAADGGAGVGAHKAAARRCGAQRGLDALDVPPGLGRRAAKAGTEHDHASPPLKILQRKSVGFHRKTGKTHAKESAVPPFFKKGAQEKIPCRRLVRPQHGFCPNAAKKIRRLEQYAPDRAGLPALASSPRLHRLPMRIAQWHAGQPGLHHYGGGPAQVLHLLPYSPGQPEKAPGTPRRFVFRKNIAHASGFDKESLSPRKIHTSLVYCAGVMG